MSVPPELRNKVHRYALASEKTYCSISTTAQDNQPPLLRTCMQIGAETPAMWYASTTSSARVYSNGFADGPLLWLSRMNKDFIRLIPKIRLERNRSDVEEATFLSIPDHATTQYADRVVSHMFWRDYDDMLKCSLFMRQIESVGGPRVTELSGEEIWPSDGLWAHQKEVLITNKIRATNFSLDHRRRGGDGALDGFKFVSFPSRGFRKAS